MRLRSLSSSPIRRFNPILTDLHRSLDDRELGILAYRPILAYLDRRNGIRHQSPSALTEFHKAPIQPAAAPQWIGVQTRHNATACARYTGYRFPAEVTIPIAISTAWLVDARYARIK